MTDGSKPLKNARHEKFVRNRLKGMSVNKAYTSAGYKPNRHNAARLLNTNEHLQARLAHLQGQTAQRAVFTVRDMANQLDEDRAFAQKQKSSSAMVQASMGKAKVLGLVVNKHLLGMKNLDDMTEDELAALLGTTATETDDSSSD